MSRLGSLLSITWLFLATACQLDTSSGNGAGGHATTSGPTPTSLIPSTTTSSSTTATGCSSPLDCAGDETCGLRTCTNGTCGFVPAPAGTPVAANTPGDCLVNVCDGNGSVMAIADDTDTPDDGNACTADECAAGVATHTPNPPDPSAAWASPAMPRGSV